MLADSTRKEENLLIMHSFLKALRLWYVFLNVPSDPIIHSAVTVPGFQSSFGPICYLAYM